MNERDSQALTELTAGLERLAAWEVQFPPVDHRVWNRQAARNTASATELLAEPGGLTALQRLSAEHPDPAVRTHAQSYAAPPPPETVEQAQNWLAHPAQRLGHLELAVAPCVYFAALGAEESAAREEGLAEWSRGSWVRGRPVGEDAWPVRDDGLPLVHVAHLDLAFLGELPSHPVPDLGGALEVFHDLVSYGLDPADGARGCWSVRFTPHSGRPVDPPPDLEVVSQAVWLHEMTGISLPWPDGWEERLSEDDVDALTDAHDAIHDLVVASAGAPSGRPLPPGAPRFTPQLLGHPQLGWGHVVEESLEPFLPLSEPGDEWVFLLDVPGVGPLEDWFADSGHLEVWIRASDLAAGAYERCWVTMRNQ